MTDIGSLCINWARSQRSKPPLRCSASVLAQFKSLTSVGTPEYRAKGVYHTAIFMCWERGVIPALIFHYEGSWIDACLANSVFV